MPEIRLTADVRTEFGKGASRRTRRAGKIPAVIYGHGGETRHVALPAHEFSNALRKNGANALLTLVVEGTDELAIAKSVQRHPIKPEIEHVDLLTVRRGEKVTVDVPLLVEGEVVPGGLLNQEFTTVSLEAEATHIPTEVTTSVEGLAIGTQVTAADLALPEGSTLAGDAAQVLLVIAQAPTAEDIEADLEDTTAGPAPTDVPEVGADDASDPTAPDES